MPRYTEFEENEEEGTVIARPSTGTDSAVRFEHGVAEWDDESSGNWEGILQHLLEEMLGNELDIDDDGNAVMDVERAASTLADTDYVRGEKRAARAIIEYLDEKEVVSVEDGRVTVLRPPHVYEEGEMDQAIKMYSNWAAAFDTLIGRIDAAVEKVQEAQDRLNARREDTTNVTEHLSELRDKREEYKQEMLSIVGDRDVDELEGDERRQFDHAREQFYHYDNQIDQVEDGGSVPEVNQDPTELGEVIEQLESTQQTFSLEQGRLRDRIREKQLWPTGAVESSEQFTNFLSLMGDTMPKQERMEEEDAQSLVDNLRESEGMQDLQQQQQEQSSPEVETEGSITNE